MDFLLETSIAKSLFGDDERVITRLAAKRETDRFYASVITEGELLFGASRALGARGRALSGQVASFLDTVTEVLPITRAVASVYASIRQDLTVHGRMIPVNDLWIAATAMSSNLTLVAHDEHFQRVDGLRVEDWLEA